MNLLSFLDKLSTSHLCVCVSGIFPLPSVLMVFSIFWTTVLEDLHRAQLFSTIVMFSSNPLFDCGSGIFIFNKTLLCIVKLSASRLFDFVSGSFKLYEP